MQTKSEDKISCIAVVQRKGMYVDTNCSSNSLPVFCLFMTRNYITALQSHVEECRERAESKLPSMAKPRGFPSLL